MEILTLLSQVGGAHEDIRKVIRNGLSPLHVALWNGHTEVVHWLILNGALAPRNDVDGGGIDDAIMRKDFWRHTKWDEDKRLTVLS